MVQYRQRKEVVCKWTNVVAAQAAVLNPTPSRKEGPDVKRLFSLSNLNLVRVTSNIHWLVVHSY